MAQILAHYRKVYGSSEPLEFFYKDNLGSSRFIISSAGTKVDEFNYTSWGVSGHPYGPSSDNYLALFTDKSYDSTGFLYFNARYYDPTSKRFVSEDPAKQGVSWFSYCNNDPINKIDSDGKFSLLSSLGSLGGIFSIGKSILEGDSAKSIFKQTFLLFTSTIISAIPGGAIASAIIMPFITSKVYGQGIQSTIKNIVMSVSTLVVSTIGAKVGGNGEYINSSGQTVYNNPIGASVGGKIGGTIFNVFNSSVIYGESAKRIIPKTFEGAVWDSLDVSDDMQNERERLSINSARSGAIAYDQNRTIQDMIQDTITNGPAL